VRSGLVVVLAAACACGNVSSGDADAAVQGDAPAAVDASIQDDAGATRAVCDDGVDNDADQLVDGWDPECTTSLDGSEDSFEIELVDKCDTGSGDECLFDFNEGRADDDTCALTTVPGCDCWGCCTMCTAGSCTTALIDPCMAPDCRFDVFSNPDLCPTCEPDPACGAPCDPPSCILCPGQTADDLPAECDGQTSCPGDVPICGADRVCPAGRWCSHGCCIVRQPG
jgi:hypothetical protein